MLVTMTTAAAAAAGLRENSYSSYLACYLNHCHVAVHVLGRRVRLTCLAPLVDGERRHFETPLTSVSRHIIYRCDVVHPKDKVKDEEKTELIYCVSCKNCYSSYVGETGRTFGLRIKEHKK